MRPLRFRVGRRTVSVQRANTVKRVQTRADARQVIQAAIEALGERSVRAMLEDLGDLAPRNSTEEVRDAFAEYLLGGTFVLVVEDDQPRRLDAPPTIRLADIAEPVATPTTSVAERSWLGIEVLAADGTRFPGERLVAELADGSLVDVLLDSDSRWRSDDVPVGSCQLRTPVRLEPAAPPGPGAEGSIEPGPDDVAWSGRPNAPISLRTGADHRLVVARSRAGCVRIVGVSFALNKAFLLPAALEGIRLLGHMYEKYAGAEVLVVGHTDTSGSVATNLSISRQRSEAVAAYLCDDVEAWYRYYEKSTPPKRRWGPAEDLSMLSALPHEGIAYYDELDPDCSAGVAVRAFQRDHGLVEDGDAGPVTRRALIREYMAADGTTLPEGTPIVTHGAGQSFLSVPTDDGVVEPGNRRVEVFFFQRGIEPSPTQSTSGPQSPWYPAWLEAIDEERTFTPSEAGYGRLIVMTDIATVFSERLATTFALRSVDGAYECTKVIGDDGVVTHEHLDLEFDNMPKGSSYTLTVGHADGRTYELFDDVPYYELVQQSRVPKSQLVSPDPGTWPEEEDDGHAEEG